MKLRTLGTILARLSISALLLLGNSALLLQRAAGSPSEGATLRLGPLSLAIDPLLVVCLAITLVLLPLWMANKSPRLRTKLSGYAGTLLWANGLALLILLALLAFGPPVTPEATLQATPTPAKPETSRRPVRPVGRTTRQRPQAPRPLAEPSPVATASATPRDLRTPQATASPEVKASPEARPTPESSIGSPATKDPYAEIDAHALAAPPHVENSIERLAAYLVRPARNDREKVRAIFRWVSDRIAYDTKSFFSGNIPDQSAERTLSTRLSVCAGYANLTHALGKAAGLKTEVILGFGRGMNADSEKPDSNHAWNAVELDGQWHLLDATWAAGSAGEDQKFHKSYDDFWFLTDPKAFLNSHRPDEDRWQLLQPVMSWEAFQNQPLLSPEFFQSGVRLSPGLSRTIEASPVAVLALDLPTEVALTGVLEDESGQEFENAVSVFREGKAATVSVKAPAVGEYTLHLYSGPYGAKQFEGILQLNVAASRADKSGYPALTGAMQQHGGRVTEPRQGVLRPGRQKFDLQIPGAQTVFVDSWDRPLQRNGDRFTGELDLSGGQAQVYAQFENDRDAVALATYQVR